MSTISVVLMVPPIQIAATDTAYYTCPVGATAKVGRAIFCNTDTAPHTITINLTSATSTAGNEVIQALGIAAGTTYVSPELAGIVVPSGYMLRGLADTAAKVTLTISGILVSG